MRKDSFHFTNRMTLQMEDMIGSCSTYDEFEKQFSDEMLKEDCRIGIYLMQLLEKYDKKAYKVSEEAYLATAYVGNVINGKLKNPTRDALIRICLVIGASVEETQYLLKYAGFSPLYVRRKRDVIIWFGLMKGEDLDTVNENILQRGLNPLFRTF